MLIDFEVENFRSFREPKRFSMVASSGKELPQNLIELSDRELTLVRTAALYGPNASGKSNLLAAMNCLSALLEFPRFRSRLIRSALLAFALDEPSVTRPSKFRVRFLVEGLLYDYFIAVRVGTVEEERLTVHPHGRPQEWFARKGNEFKFGSSLKGQKEYTKKMTTEDASFLAVAAAFDHRQLTPPAEWIASNLRDRFGLLDSSASPLSEATARRCLEDASFHSWASAFLRHADLGIQRVEIEVSEQKVRRPMRQFASDESRTTTVQDITEVHHEPYFIHSGNEGITARIGLRDESRGTRRLFAMLAPLYSVLRTGELVVVDELSASIHPSLVRELIRVFHDPLLNPKGAQLVFATHDASLLSGGLFRRDQVWFTEKDPGGATDLYCLQDIKGVREDETFEKSYLRGRYGAIPFFGQFDFPSVSEASSEAAVPET